MIDPQEYKQVAAALMTFALETSNAAVEIENARTSGAAISPAAERIVALWQGAQPAGRTYMHPTAQAIAADAETELFAIITAQRAMCDALAESALPAELKLRAIMRLALAIAPNGHDQVREAAAEPVDVRPLSHDAGMRVVSKALSMASYCASAGKPMPAEMADFIAHASWAVEGNILPPGPAASNPNSLAVAVLELGDNVPVYEAWDLGKLSPDDVQSLIKKIDATVRPAPQEGA